MLHPGTESKGHPGPVQQQVAAASKAHRAERVGGSALDRDTQGWNPGLRLPEGFQLPAEPRDPPGQGLCRWCQALPAPRPGISTRVDTQQDFPPLKVGTDPQKKGDSNNDAFQSHSARGGLPPRRF